MIPQHEERDWQISERNDRIFATGPHLQFLVRSEASS